MGSGYKFGRTGGGRPRVERVGHPRRRRLVAALESERSSTRIRAPASVVAELRHKTSADRINKNRDLLAAVAFSRFSDKSTN